ncbi:uncharacterized protein [Antedon mediterranea]|uniref:uncharacterized protein n=1 Tax=Antedon mediterranea TaxID=105859 RepID=UPI003AF64D85
MTSMLYDVRTIWAGLSTDLQVIEKVSMRSLKENKRESSVINQSNEKVKSSKRHRRGKKKSRNDKNNECSNIKIAFNNVNRVKSKIYEIDHFLKDNSIQILGLAETFLQNDQTIDINSYKWIGKNRKSKNGGGIGFLISEAITIMDDNYFDPHDDYERLWIKVKLNNNIIYIAVAYFPVEGTDACLSDELYNQLLSEILQIENEKAAHILIMGDFNARIDWSNYQKELKDTFEEWNANEFDCPNMLWSSWRSKLLQAANKTIGFKNKKCKHKRWWDSNIDHLIKDRKAASKEHRHWVKSNKNTVHGNELWQNYQHKRKAVKHAINKKIMQVRIDKSAQISENGGVSSKNFWTNLRGCNRKKVETTSIKLPNSDKTTTDKCKIKETICQYWKTLGQSNLGTHDYSIKQTKEEINNLRNKSDECNIGTQNSPQLCNIYISMLDIKWALGQCKNHKAPGIDSIPNELLKFGGDKLIQSLSQLFNRLLELQTIPDEWNKGIIIPVHKKGPKNDLNNYRGITLNSCVSKVFTRIISNNISKFLESNNILSEIQGGFRKDHRCDDHIFTLKCIASTRQAEGKNTYMAFLDFRKAFDTVWRDKLLTTAWDIGIKGNVWKMLFNIYNNVHCKVKFGEIETEYFEIEEGVKQGYALSPILFCIYINEFAKLLRENKMGIEICNVQLSGLFWADDVVLLANDERELQEMLDLATKFSNDYKLKFNYEKSNVLITGKRTDKQRLWPLSDHYISEVNSYKYLGSHITRSLSDHCHIEEVIKKGYRIIAYIKSIINDQDDYNRVFYGDLLWKTLGLPSINYACSTYVCGGISDIQNLEKLQTQMAKAILKAPRTTCKEALYGDLGWKSISTIQDMQRIYFLNRLVKMDMSRWPKLAFSAMLFIGHTSTFKWKWYNHMQNTLDSCGMSHRFKLTTDTNNQWVIISKSIIKSIDGIQIFDQARKKTSLMNYVTLKSTPYIEPYLLDKLDFLGASLKFKARSNTLALNLKKSIWEEDNDGTCPIYFKCKQATKDDIVVARENGLVRLYNGLPGQRGMPLTPSHLQVQPRISPTS